MVDQYYLELLLHELAEEARKVLPKEETMKKAEATEKPKTYRELL